MSKLLMSESNAFGAQENLSRFSVQKIRKFNKNFLASKSSKQIHKNFLIFDFDGTIVDTKTIYYNSIYNVLKNFGYKYKDIDKAIDIGLSLKKTLSNLGFSFLVSWFLKIKIMNQVKNHVNEIKKCKDIDSIKLIKEEKILITNSLKEFAIPVLKHLKIKKYFKEIYGADDFSDKAEFIKKYLKNRKIISENCYYIGDRAADTLVARKSGCKSIIISNKCSWDSRREIIKSKPDYIIFDIKEIDKIIQ